MLHSSCRPSTVCIFHNHPHISSYLSCFFVWSTIVESKMWYNFKVVLNYCINVTWLAIRLIANDKQMLAEHKSISNDLKSRHTIESLWQRIQCCTEASVRRCRGTRLQQPFIIPKQIFLHVSHVQWISLCFFVPSYSFKATTLQI